MGEREKSEKLEQKAKKFAIAQDLVRTYEQGQQVMNFIGKFIE